MKPLIAFTLVFLPLCTVLANNHTDVEAETDSIFTMSIRSTELELNPLYSYTALEQQVYSAIYEGLVSYDPRSLRPIPASAERWEVLEDGRLYRFHIHPNAYYSNGDKVESGHFRDAWLRMLELGKDAPFGFLLDPVANAAEYRAGTLRDSSLVGISAPEPSILELRLNFPSRYFLAILAHQSMVAIHPSQLNLRNWNSIDQLIGNGPYALAGGHSASAHSDSGDSDGDGSESAQSDSGHSDEGRPNGSDSTSPNNASLEFIRNDYYWDAENVGYDRIRIRLSTDSAETRRQFNNNEIQWIYSGFDSLLLYSRSDLQIFPQFSTSYYFFTTQQDPFDDERVRRALLLLLPLNEIRSEDVYNFPTATLVPQVPGYPDISGITAGDRESALDLLEQAGYPNGANLPPIRVLLSDSAEARRIAEIMEGSWEEALGVNVELQYRDFFEYQNSLRTENFTVGGVSWIGDYADPLAFLQLWKSDSTLNTAGFRNAEFDEILENSNGLNFEERYAQLALAEELLLESGIILPVNHSPSVHVIDLQRVSGWYANILDIHPFKYLREREESPPQLPPGVTLAPQVLNRAHRSSF